MPGSSAFSPAFSPSTNGHHAEPREPERRGRSDSTLSARMSALEARVDRILERLSGVPQAVPGPIVGNSTGQDFFPSNVPPVEPGVMRTPIQRRLFTGDAPPALGDDLTAPATI